MVSKIQKLCDSYVTYYIFIWVIGILSGGIGLAIKSSMEAKAEVKANQSKIDIIDSNYAWIKENITEIKLDIKEIKNNR
jgi:hypothetical protein